MTIKRDVYAEVTDKIVAMLEAGTRPWHKPWGADNLAAAVRPLRHNGIPYQGINVILLWCAAMERGFASPMWMTFKQAKDLGAHVRKGEKGSPVVYANTIVRREEGDDGEDHDRVIPFMKSYTVFNVEQIEDLPAHYHHTPEPAQTGGPERIAALEDFFAATGADIRHGGNRAFYAIMADFVQMPPIECFEAAESYYATLAHETTHWTRHPSRLDRDFGRKRWGDEGYAMEELVAELGAAFLCADLGITPEVREDHASYIDSWLRVLKGDKRAIFTAAAHAQRAADLLHDLQAPTGAAAVAAE